MKFDKYAIILTVTSAVGSCITNLIGGWTSSITTLLIFMCIDYITGLIDAGIFKTSQKTVTGGLSSKVGFKGIAKKAMVLAFLIIGNRLDLTLNTHYIRDMLCIGFIANELISITENAGLMGLPVPSIIKKAIDVLNNRSNVTTDITDEVSKNIK
jgi:toxin secretion/phage lysis holin